MKIVLNSREINLIYIVGEIAKYKLWDNDVGDKKAMDLIKEHHNRNFSRHGGIWVELGKLLEKLAQNFPYKKEL